MGSGPGAINGQETPIAAPRSVSQEASTDTPKAPEGPDKRVPVNAATRPDPAPSEPRRPSDPTAVNTAVLGHVSRTTHHVEAARLLRRNAHVDSQVRLSASDSLIDSPWRVEVINPESGMVTVRGPPGQPARELTAAELLKYNPHLAERRNRLPVDPSALVSVPAEQLSPEYGGGRNLVRAFGNDPQLSTDALARLAAQGHRLLEKAPVSSRAAIRAAVSRLTEPDHEAFVWYCVLNRKRRLTGGSPLDRQTAAEEILLITRLVNQGAQESQIRIAVARCRQLDPTGRRVMDYALSARSEAYRLTFLRALSSVRGPHQMGILYRLLLQSENPGNAAIAARRIFDTVNAHEDAETRIDYGILERCIREVARPTDGSGSRGLIVIYQAERAMRVLLDATPKVQQRLAEILAGAAAKEAELAVVLKEISARTTELLSAQEHQQAQGLETVRWVAYEIEGKDRLWITRNTTVVFDQLTKASCGYSVALQLLSNAVPSLALDWNRNVASYAAAHAELMGGIRIHYLDPNSPYATKEYLARQTAIDDAVILFAEQLSHYARVKGLEEQTPDAALRTLLTGSQYNTLLRTAGRRKIPSAPVDARELTKAFKALGRGLGKRRFEAALPNIKGRPIDRFTEAVAETSIDLDGNLLPQEGSEPAYYLSAVVAKAVGQDYIKVMVPTDDAYWHDLHTRIERAISEGYDVPIAAQWESEDHGHVVLSQERLPEPPEPVEYYLIYDKHPTNSMPVKAGELRSGAFMTALTGMPATIEAFYLPEHVLTGYHGYGWG